MMPWFGKRFFKPARDPLTVSMSGLKLGDRLLMVGCGDAPLMAALTSKVGLTGRACMIDESAERTARAAVAVEKDGALVETFTSALTTMPFERDEFDVVVARNVLPLVPAERRPAVVGEITRVVRPGGRCLVIDDVARGTLGGLIGAPRDGEATPSTTLAGLLSAAGFRGVRTLAEREGITFVEGVKPGRRA